MSQQKKVRKAVIAAAGFGTRLLPQTKAMPKEMLPLVDKPIIQHVVEQLVEAGIEDIIIVSGYSKRSIEDHFDQPSQGLLQNLEQGGPKKAHLIEEIKRISDLANFVYIRQKGPYGTGTPILNAEHLIGDEPFIYTFCDDFILSKPNEFKQLIEAYNEFDCSVMASIRARKDSDYDQFGFVGGEEIRPGIIDVKTLVEKPGKGNVPSEFATVSSYLYTSDIFNSLKQLSKNIEEGREFYANEAQRYMIAEGKRVVAYEVQNGKYYDTGNKLDYLKTVIDLALMRDDIKEDLATYLRGLPL